MAKCPKPIPSGSVQYWELAHEPQEILWREFARSDDRSPPCAGRRCRRHLHAQDRSWRGGRGRVAKCAGFPDRSRSCRRNAGHEHRSTPKARRPFNERVDVQRTRGLGLDAATRDEPEADAVVPFLQFVQEPQRAGAPKVFRNPRAAARKSADAAPSAVAPAPRIETPAPVMPAPTFAQATTPVADPPVMLATRRTSRSIRS